MRRASVAAWSRAFAVLRRHRARLLRRAGVVGVDVGVRIRDGRATTTPAIRVHVRHKVPRAALDPRRVLPASIEGVPLDVVAGPYGTRDGDCPDPEVGARHDPLVGGIAIGRDGFARQGTLTLCGRDAAGRRVGVTVAHVVGAGATDRVVQPPRTHASIGRTDRTRLDATVDAARVVLSAARDYVAGTRDVRPFRGFLDPIPDTALPLDVTVHGACSGTTRAQVTSKSYGGELSTGHGPIQLVGHLHLVGLDGVVSRRGDSGAAIVEAGTGRLVGVLRGGTDPDPTVPAADAGPDVAIGIPILRVLQALEVGAV